MREMSGEEEGPLEGRRVGVSLFKEMSCELSREAEMEEPRVSARDENQVGSWALKSPRIKESVVSKELMMGSMLKV